MPRISSKELSQELFELEEDVQELKEKLKIENLENAVGQFVSVAEKILSIQKHEVSSEKVFEYMKVHGLEKPIFKFLHSEQAREWLQINNLLSEDAYTSSPDAILIYDLPKPVAYWWWKGYHVSNPKTSGDEKSIDYNDATEISHIVQSEGLGKSITNWANIYSEGLPYIWELRDVVNGLRKAELLSAETEKTLHAISVKLSEYAGLGIRINEIGQHEPLHYYYVWGWWLTEYRR